MLKTKSLIVTILILFLLAGCGGEAEEEPLAWAGEEPTSYPEFVAGLEAQGVSVEPLGEDTDSLFEDTVVQSVLIDAGEFDEATIHVFAFEDAEAQEAALETISEVGLTVGGREIEWPAQPYFWSLGNLIILYTEADDEVIAYLTGVLGVPVNEVPGR